ncbi:MAG: protein kinase [Verrucomicrobiae bacterium]|nr:protein kinase [Verrucomicrobiae bacterium]
MGETSKILGNYELLEEIGKGAEGRVHKAVCVADGLTTVQRGELVAIKRLIRTGHEKESQLFRRQIEILSRLNHPNIVRYIDSFVWRENELEEDIHCLVMELLEGRPLKLLVKQRELAWPSIRQILLLTLDALQYAAKNGVIHRDLKPSNIFVTRGEIPKLIDFGIARQDDGEATATSSAAGAKGTFDYMAPDFARQQGDFRGDEKSDVFSFGIILYEALAGELPFPALDENAIRGYFLRWLGPKPPALEFRNPVFRVLTGARTCISKCVDPDREQRLKTFTEVSAEFSKISYRKLKHGSEVFEFREWLGKGGFGEVFRAVRLRDGREVAIKRLFSAGQSSRFVREAKILRNAAHPNLTEYVDFVEVRQRDDEHEYYLVLEYLDGMPYASLRDRIKNSPNGMDAMEVMELFIAYLDCLEHLHQNGIIHRDIKPGNLYAPPGNPQKAKIFDLGIAHDEEGTRTHGQVPGTLDFMPPEFATQASGRGSAQSDIYSIGVTFYQALTKNLPFPRLPEKEADAWVAFFKRSLNPVKCAWEHPVFTSHPELISLLDRALAQDPGRRFPSAAAMRDEIKKIVQLINVKTAKDLAEEEPTGIISKKDLLAAAPPAPVAPPVVVEAAPVADDEAETKKADFAKIEAEMAAAAAAAPIEPVVEAPQVIDDEAETKRADLARIEAEMAAAAAAEAAEKKRLADAKRLALEQKRQAAEAIERKAREERERQAAAEARLREQEEAGRRAIIRAERAAKARRVFALAAKVAGVLILVAALAVGGYLSWNKAKARMIENRFNAAVQKANDAFKQADFQTAIDDANQALAIHAQDQPMQSLIADAQAQIKVRESYAGAFATARTAFQQGDLTNAVVWVEKALQKLPTDPTALKFLQEAQGRLDRYHNAFSRANAANDHGDFTTARDEAGRALEIYPADPAMQRVKSRALDQITVHEAFNGLMKKAQAAFDGGDYSGASAQATEALQKIPNEPGALSLRNRAQKLVSDFATAVETANSAFSRGDFIGAGNAADNALAIYQNDAAMLKLKGDAQKQAGLHKAFSQAFKKAQAAFADHDYTNTVILANAALHELADEPNATKLRNDAQLKLNAHAQAVAAANAAFKANNFSEAIAQADLALDIYQNDAGIRQLKNSAQGEIDRRKDYEAALKRAQTAFDSYDFATAKDEAEKALLKMPGDPAASKLRDDAKNSVAAFDRTAQLARTYLQQKNYIEAIKSADLALALRKNDPAMTQFKEEIIKRLDATLVYFMECFNVTPIPPELKLAETQKGSTLGAISNDDKAIYQKQADDLQKAYAAAKCLEEKSRKTSLYQLSLAIANW